MTDDVDDIGAQCALPTCRTLDWLPIACTACQLRFCRHHAARDDHGCPADIPVARVGPAVGPSFAELLPDRQAGYAAIDAKREVAMSSKEERSRKARDLIAKNFARASPSTVQPKPAVKRNAVIERMRLKGKAVPGDLNKRAVAEQDRVYFLARCHTSAGSSESKSVWLDESTSIGRSLDLIAAAFKVHNVNHQTSDISLRLALFKPSDLPRSLGDPFASAQGSIVTAMSSTLSSVFEPGELSKTSWMPELWLSSWHQIDTSLICVCRHHTFSESTWLLVLRCWLKFRESLGRIPMAFCTCILKTPPLNLCTPVHNAQNHNYELTNGCSVSPRGEGNAAHSHTGQREHAGNGLQARDGNALQPGSSRLGAADLSVAHCCQVIMLLVSLDVQQALQSLHADMTDINTTLCASCTVEIGFQSRWMVAVVAAVRLLVYGMQALTNPARTPRWSVLHELRLLNAAR
ncbi:uncharacterized protein L969DRAFT_50243 [Mixia osmundae IAM 14324]|uniref:AN1-type domain-containing protein n=1 Tax=Mixia osmundae (strain CBS 9802 / IAM 14324 / JCM 22182 / KY 12970) TaxID=764103 RepID=G7E6N7_MIXOS|nr:uncharacterized protein L969DRAFT_50243 [Mixia osmundae IAM 14324]KEI39123.1 hypothetical protein L969DRAFT_50243 [Mixia osmundae IAM 14324]GAA98497.1 hypothetical protein E5Q_05183 [Mixia osmundae IAM 14324]